MIWDSMYELPLFGKLVICAVSADCTGGMRTNIVFPSNVGEVFVESVIMLLEKLI